MQTATVCPHAATICPLASRLGQPGPSRVRRRPPRVAPSRPSGPGIHMRAARLQVSGRRLQLAAPQMRSRVFLIPGERLPITSERSSDATARFLITSGHSAIAREQCPISGGRTVVRTSFRPISSWRSHDRGARSHDRAARTPIRQLRNAIPGEQSRDRTARKPIARVSSIVCGARLPVCSPRAGVRGRRSSPEPSLRAIPLGRYRAQPSLY
jgi:hypothetical protein